MAHPVLVYKFDKLDQFKDENQKSIPSMKYLTKHATIYRLILKYDSWKRFIYHKLFKILKLFK